MPENLIPFPEGVERLNKAGNTKYRANAILTEHRPDENTLYFSGRVSSTGNTVFSWLAVPDDPAILLSLASAILEAALGKRETKRFYVTLTWHGWPEGGSFGTVVEAADEAAAESLARQAMARHYATQYKIEDEPDQCSNCGNTDQDGSDTCIDCGGTDCSWTPGATAVDLVLDDHGEDWNLVDCFDLDEFIASNAKTE